jgi:phosphatidylglycerol:prolipoprotein diacylglycerol transferase
MAALLALAPTLASIGWKVLDRFRFGGKFAISPHGLGIAVGFLAGAYVLVSRESAKRGITEEEASTYIFWALIGSIVGARFFYVVAHWGEPGLKTVGDALAVYKGGISLIGGIVGAIIAGLPNMRRFKHSFFQVMDSAAIGLPLGIVIGRIGDLVIGDHLGKPTSWLFAFVYKGGSLSGYDCSAGVCTSTLFGGRSQTITAGKAVLFGPNGAQLSQGVGVHQTALYDFVSTMVLILVLVYLNRQVRRRGVLFLTFAAWYGAVRIVTDFLRVDKRFFGLTGSQWASAAVLAACLGALAWFALRPQRTATDGNGGAPDDEPVGTGLPAAEAGAG